MQDIKEFNYYETLSKFQETKSEHYKMSGLCDVVKTTDGGYGVEIPKFEKKKKSDDGNANTRDRYIGILLSEFNLPFEKTENYRMLCDKMTSIYGKHLAYRFLLDDIIGAIYTHNARNIGTKPYCFAYDFDRLASEGAFFTDIYDKPAQHLDSFIQHVIEFVAVHLNNLPN